MNSKKSTYILDKSKVKNKKYSILTPDNKLINFGDKRYDDFTTHKDMDRRDRYLKRSKNLNVNKPNNANFFARMIL